jgi:hypothetical protein
MPHFADGLRRERNRGGDAGRAYTPGQLQQCQGAKDHPDLLHATAEQVLELLLFLPGDFDAQGWTRHTPSMRRNNSA